MFSSEFALIAARFPSLTPFLDKVSQALDRAGHDPVLQTDSFSRSAAIAEETVEAVFDMLVEQGLLRRGEQEVCTSCGSFDNSREPGEKCACGATKRTTRQCFRIVSPAPPQSYAERRAVRLAGEARFAIITALPEEAAAVQALLMEPVALPRGQAAKRVYDVAEMPALNSARHAIVHACLPAMGTNSAAARASVVFEDFPSVKSILMVGIAGGAPNHNRPAEHVRLGDIVVSDAAGVVQYDFVKKTASRATIRNPPRPPSAELVEASKRLEASSLLGERPWNAHIAIALESLKGSRPPEESDRLSDPRDASKVVAHPTDEARFTGEPRVFRGVIGSSNTLLKDPVLRDRLRDDYCIRAIEMEASGIADASWHQQGTYFVVRGICDYCNAQKNDIWHLYAAVAAAAYARALLHVVPK